jgi:hypothetical protein
MSDLSVMEQEALDWLKHKGGSVLITDIPEKNIRGVFGLEPGLTVFKKLEKKGLVAFTEEEPFQLDNGEWFEYTSSVELL